MILWQVKEHQEDEYITMKTPSRFQLKGTDLDKKTYRSCETGNINRPTILGKKWKSAKFTINYLTEEEAEEICKVLDYYPMFTKFKSPHGSANGMWEGQCYCNEWDIDMQRNNETGAEWSNLSFTLVQGKRNSGQ